MKLGVCIRCNASESLKQEELNKSIPATTVAYSVPYGMHGMQQPPSYPPPPVYLPPNNGHPPPPLPEGLQSQPPASGGLPGNHRVV